jgi:hypothetical protein
LVCSSLTSIVIELALFSVTIALMLWTKDLQPLLQPNNHNLVLLVAFGAVLGPLLQEGQGYKASLPTLLIVPSLFYIGLFGWSIIVELRAKLG